MDIKHKSADLIEVKTDGQTGVFSGLVAVFHNVDRGGDRILPGAFDQTLKQWRATGDPIPIILSHDWNNPWSHIGYVDPQDIEPTAKGLFVKKGVLDVEDNDVAKQVHKLMKRRSLKEFSFGYTVNPGGEQRTKDGVNELSSLNLVEVGPTLKGMNPATELHGVKSALEAQAKTGFVPGARILRQRAALIERAAAEDSFPELGPPPPPRPATELPDAPDADQLRKTAAAVAAEHDRETSARQRAADESRIPYVPPAPPAPIEPEQPVAADADSLRARANAIEDALVDETAARRRAAEEAQIPDVAPAPVPTPAPVAPDAAELRARAAAMDAELAAEAAARRRAAEEGSLPQVAPPPAPAPVPPAPVIPDAASLRARADAADVLDAELVSEVAARRRAAEESSLPQVGAAPTPPVVPDADELYARAQALEAEMAAEHADRARAAEEAAIPQVGPAPVPEPEPTPPVAPDPVALRAAALRLEQTEATRIKTARREAEELSIPYVPPAPQTVQVATIPEPTMTPTALKALADVIEGEIVGEGYRTKRAREEAGLPELPPAPMPTPAAVPMTKEALREFANAIEGQLTREQAAARRRREEASLPDVGSAPMPQVAPAARTPIDPAALRAMAAQAESGFELSQRAAMRAQEEASLPDVGPAPFTIVDELHRPIPMDAKTLREMADAATAGFELDSRAHARAREEASLPDLGPAAVPAPAPEPQFSPETLRAMADDLDRQQREEERLRVKAAETALITGVDPGPAAAAPRPADPPVAMDAAVLRAKARRLEESHVDQTRRERRAAEEALLPDLPPAPAPEPQASPTMSADALWRKAQRLEREYQEEMDQQAIAAAHKGITIDGDKATVARNYQLVSPAHKARLHGLIEHYRKNPHPFTACVTDNRKRFGERAERVCAVLKDIMENTTYWRGHEGKDAHFEELHPRDHGRFSRKPGAGAAVEALASGGTKPGLRNAKIPKLGGVAKGQPGSKENPIDVGGDIDKAAALLREGKHVKLQQPRQVAILADKLADLVNKAKEQGDKAPNFDLCKVTVPGTNLFCVGNKGVPRIKMPQLKGVPSPGTRAAGMDADERGEVEVTKQFAQHLKSKGVKLHEGREKSVMLRPTQMEINGGKVGGMKKFLDGGGKFGGDPRFFVSRDNYILDGHHRWAALTAYDLEDNKPGDIDVPIVRIDMDIADLLDEANQFAADIGIPQADVSQMPEEAKKSAGKDISYGPGVTAPMVVSPPSSAGYQDSGHSEAEREAMVQKLLDELDGDEEAQAIIDYLESCLADQQASKPTKAMDAAALRAKADAMEAEMRRADEEARLPLVPDDPTDYAMKSYMRGVRNSYELAEVMDGRTIYEDGSVMHVRAISIEEHEGVKDGLVKAVWTTAYVNNLPDSAFLYVASGGSKDGEGKTVPRSNRYFPVRDADGNVDLPHLRNALARIPQSNLPADVKDRCINSAQRLLSGTGKTLSIPDGTGKGTYESRPVDPLRELADEVELEFVSDAMSTAKPPKSTGPTQPAPTPEVPMRDLREQMREAALSLFIDD